LKAIEVGCDIVCAQGGEGGGHTGDIPTSILIPSVVDIVKGHKSPLTGDPIFVVAAGGVYDSRGLAAALQYGAQGVWVGTRFVACEEANAPPAHQKAVLRCGLTDTIRTTIFTGRPLRVIKNDYILEWEEGRRDELAKLLKSGKIPYTVDVEAVSDPSPQVLKHTFYYR
jgi:NAD(P)H-dependent flavin oxidoreductase YrpB (nitropropane dioxygenase family)